MFIGFIGLLVIIGIFFLCRELMCWYWKINQSLENQEKMISLLQQLVDKKPISLNGNSTTVRTGYESYIGQQVKVTQKNGLVIHGQVVASSNPEEYLSLQTSGDILKIKLDFIKEIN